MSKTRGAGREWFCPTPFPCIYKYQSKLWLWGSLASRAPFSTRETKRGAAGLHRIKQSLNASSCYALPNETFMKGPLMWFQKHLVISPEYEWMLLSHSAERQCPWFYWPACISPIPPVVLFLGFACEWQRWSYLASEERTQRIWIKACLCSPASGLLEVISLAGFLTPKLLLLFFFLLKDYLGLWSAAARGLSHSFHNLREKKAAQTNRHDLWVSHSVRATGFLKKTPDIRRLERPVILISKQMSLKHI